jgi:hypothetical protein
MGNGNDNGKGKGSGDGQGNGNQPSTYLVIPYYAGDTGSRPLPSADPVWMCTSILVNGAPYAGQHLMAGQTVELDLDAVNYGTLTAPTVCQFYYANPTTAFTTATVNVIGAASGALARNDPAELGPVSWTIPEGLPEHICLLAEVTTPADAPPLPLSYNAAADRHYGQQNIYVTSAAPGGQIRVPFVMANAAAAVGRFRLEVTHMLAHHRALRHVIARQAVLREAEHIELRQSRSKVKEDSRSLDVELVGDEARDVELSARVPRDATPGSTIVLQLAQYQHHRHHPVGGLGVVVHVT